MAAARLRPGGQVVRGDRKGASTLRASRDAGLISIVTTASPRLHGAGRDRHRLRAGTVPIHSLEPFLPMLSSIFVRLFGVGLPQLAGRGETPVETPWRWGPAVVWLLGIACFHAIAQLRPEGGFGVAELGVDAGQSRAARFDDDGASGHRVIRGLLSPNGTLLCSEAATWYSLIPPGSPTP